MRGPRVAGNPAAAGSPAPAGGTTAGSTAATAGAGTRARAGTPAGATPPSRPAGDDSLSARERGPSPMRRAARLAREHWLLTVLLTAGLVLRVLAQIAYRPALIYIDSLRYLYHAHGADPVGYRVPLRPQPGQPLAVPARLPALPGPAVRIGH